MSRVLLVSHEQGTSGILNKLLKTEGFKVIFTADLSRGLEYLQTQQFSLLITTPTQEWDADLTLVKAAAEGHPHMPCVLIVDPADETIRQRAQDAQPYACLEKPLKVDRLLATVHRAVDFDGEDENADYNLNLQLETCYAYEGLVSESPQMQNLCDMINRVAATAVTVLITGERGVGKGLIANTIHRESRRSKHEFVEVECARPDVSAKLYGDGEVAGSLEKAAGGTLFLREVSGLPAPVQQSLLQALTTRTAQRLNSQHSFTVDVRVIATSRTDLDKLVAHRAFHEALLKFLRVIVLDVPPLRERRQDILPTARELLRRFCADERIPPSIDGDLAAFLETSSWPGNVAEMSSVLEQALRASTGAVLSLSHLRAEAPEAEMGTRNG